MKSVIFFLAFVATSASAADLKTRPPVYTKAPIETAFSWSGFYLSGYGAYGANLSGTTLNMGTATVDMGGIPHGPGVGGSLEVLYDTGVWVLGVRGDIGIAAFKGSGAASVSGFPLVTVSNATNYLGSFNAELGYKFAPRLLGYVTGGLGFGGLHPNLQVMGLQAAASDTSVGWDFGAGLRYALTDNWSVFIEGDYFDLGAKSLTATLNGVPVATSTNKLNFIEQRAGISFKF